MEMNELRQLYEKAVKAINTIPFHDEWEIETIQLEYKIENGDEGFIGIYVNINHRVYKYLTQIFFETGDDFDSIIEDILIQIHNRTIR